MKFPDISFVPLLLTIGKYQLKLSFSWTTTNKDEVIVRSAVSRPIEVHRAERGASRRPAVAPIGFTVKGEK